MTDIQFRSGKIPARKDAVKLAFRAYLPKGALPAVPAAFGHENLVHAFGMLGNDVAGDCVFAGAGNETTLWTAEGKAPATFTTANALSDYTALTGYDPKDPSSDRGTDMEFAAKYRRTKGVVDSKGRRHKVAAYLALTPGDLHEHLLAAYLFGAVGIGIEFPAFAMDEFNAFKPWDLQRTNSKIEGGHYVPVVAHRGNLKVVTWGRVQDMTPAFFGKYNDESIAYVSTEMLTNGVSLEGFKLADLQADLNAITGAK